LKLKFNFLIVSYLSQSWSACLIIVFFRVEDVPDPGLEQFIELFEDLFLSDPFPGLFVDQLDVVWTQESHQDTFFI